MEKKVLIFVLVVLAALSAVGCGGIGIEVPAKPQLNDFPVLVNMSESADTKIAHDRNALVWEQDDKIQLTAIADGIEVADTVGVAEIKYYGLVDNDPTRASFSGFITLRNAPRECYFTHPYGAAMTVDALSGNISANYTQQDGTHSPFLYGKTDYPENPSTGINLMMNHVGSVLKLDIEVEGVATVSFVGNALESLSPVIIDPDTHELASPTESVKQITVPVQENGPTYLFVPPVNLEKGFSLICSRADGSYFVKSYSDGQSGGYDFSAKRGVMIPVTVSGEFTEFSITASDAATVQTKSSADLWTGTSVSFKMNVKGTPNKLIDGWGADLYDTDGNLVRTYRSTEGITGGTVTMDVVNGMIILSGGSYVLAPYYIMYNKPHALQEQLVSVDDITLTLSVEAQTSYNKYLSALKDEIGIDKANSHAWNKIEGVTVRTNIDPSIINSYSASICLGKDQSGKEVYATADDKSQLSGGEASYGDLTAVSFGKCLFSAEIKCGHRTLTAQNEYHITGLPYKADFKDSNPNGWSPAWGLVSATYSNNRVVLRGTSAVRTPKFHVPADIKVITYSDCRHNVTGSWGRPGSATMYIASCSEDATNIPTATTSLSFGSDYYQAAGSFGDVSGFDSKGYLVCNTQLTLTPSLPSLMFSVSLGSSTLGSNTFVSFGHKIEYSK